MVLGYGSGGGSEFSIQNRNEADIATFHGVSQNDLMKLMKREEIAQAFSTYSIDYPQLAVDVDVSKCKCMGVNGNYVYVYSSGAAIQAIKEVAEQGVIITMLWHPKRI